jgi:hypothetical protein
MFQSTVFKERELTEKKKGEIKWLVDYISQHINQSRSQSGLIDQRSVMVFFFIFYFGVNFFLFKLILGFLID